MFIIACVCRVYYYSDLTKLGIRDHKEQKVLDCVNVFPIMIITTIKIAITTTTTATTTIIIMTTLTITTTTMIIATTTTTTTDNNNR